jgi:hypothetical protein
VPAPYYGGGGFRGGYGYHGYYGYADGGYGGHPISYYGYIPYGNISIILYCSLLYYCIIRKIVAIFVLCKALHY